MNRYIYNYISSAYIYFSCNKFSNFFKLLFSCEVCFENGQNNEWEIKEMAANSHVFADRGEDRKLLRRYHLCSECCGQRSRSLIYSISYNLNI